MRFLWYNNVYSDKIEIERYRFRRVIFGATSSQFLLNSTIHKHADKYEDIDPEVARKARNNFYVDDLTTGVKNVEDGIELYQKFKIRFMEANFNIRKWKTNNKNLKTEIEKRENYLGTDVPFNQKDSTKKYMMKSNDKENYEITNTKRNCEINEAWFRLMRLT